MTLRFGTEREAGIYEGTAQKIETLAKRWIESGFTTSVAYLASHKGVVFAYGAEGTRTHGESAELLKPDTIFPIASITKILTGICIFILTEEGLLGPTRPVIEFIPEFTGEYKEQVLIHHLLTHTSGINNEDTWRFVQENKDSIEVPEGYAYDKDFYIGCKAPLWKAPGQEMSYCGFGFKLMGEIIKRISGMSLDRFFTERIFKPLGMKDSYLVVPDEVTDRVIQYPDNAIFKNNSKPESLKSQHAAGGAFSTAYDLAVLGQMMQNKGTYNGVRLLSRASVEAMTRNQTKGIMSQYEGRVFKESGWGLPFMLALDKTDETGTLRSPQAFSHTGAGCTMLFIDPVYDIVATCMMVSLDSFGDGTLDRKFDNYLNVVLSGVL